MTRREQLVLVLLSVTVAMGAVAMYMNHSKASDDDFESSGVDTPAMDKADPPQKINELDIQLAPVAQPIVVTPPEMVKVSIVGAVGSPGVYELPGDSRVEDLISKARGATKDADLSDINLAAKLMDGSTLIVPEKLSAQDGRTRGRASAGQWHSQLNPPQYTLTGWHSQPQQDTPVAAANGSGGTGSGRLINVNTASQEQLETLPGIGPVFAQGIIRYRKTKPFRTVDDLDNVNGIGEKRLDAIRPFISVR